jgi:thiamine-phosphate pyrophosphorylase
VAPPDLGAGGRSIDDFLVLLPAALAAGDVACLRLAAGLGAAAIQRIARLVQAHDVACLVEGDATLALDAGADGLHLADAGPGAVSAARTRLGSLSLGVACGSSRHDAMVAAEQGADYIQLERDAVAADEEFLALVEWWSELMTVPLVAGSATSPAAAGAWAQAGADFVALDPACWTASDPVAAIAAHQQAIDQATAARARLAS